MSDTGVPCPGCEARIELLSLMAELSERIWCAGWLTGLERKLWSLVRDDEHAADLDQTGYEDKIARLGQLSYRAGGWWVWDDDLPHGGPGAHHRRFVGIEEWLEMYPKLIEKRKARKRRFGS